MNATLPTDPASCPAPDRLRWIADFLDLAGKAISVIACVRGLEYPEELHAAAQEDLRAWAHWLDARPELVADLDLARIVPAAQEGDSSQLPTSPHLPTTHTSPFAPPPWAEGEGNFDHGSSPRERRLDVCS
ncbi:MAG: hypothetical protein ABR972_05320 [Acidimicrobiales bacterium]